MVRTLPQQFPFMTPADAKAGMADKASIVRNLAQAQNYLWANLRNVWAGFAFEGNGNLIANRLVDPSTSSLVIPGQTTTPSGRQAMPVAQFIVPKNWSSGSRLRVTCWMTATGTAKDSGFVEVQLFDMNGVPVGAPGIDSTVGTVARADVDVDVPRTAGQLQAVIYLSDRFTYNVTVGFQSMRLLNYSARFINAANDVFGVTLDPWKNFNDLARNPDFSGGPFAGAAFYMRAINNTLSLWSEQNPHICHGQLEKHWNNTNAAVEVGRWVIRVPFACTARFDFAERRVSAANAWAVLVDGVSVASGSLALATAQSEQGGTFSLAAGEHIVTITFNAGASASAAEYGAQLLRFKLIEEARTFTGFAAPASFQPLDESLLQGDKEITLSTLHQLQWNDRWLFANRRMVFIADYVARTLKAFGYDVNDMKTDARTQYTQHPREVDLPYSSTRVGWRNCTNSRGTLVNDEANTPAPPPIANNGVTPDDTFFGGAGTGYSTGAFTGLWYWPDSGSWPTTGRMLFFQRGDTQVLAGVRQRRILARARRLRPALLVSDDEADGRFSPWGRDASYQRRSFLDIDPNGTGRRQRYINGNSDHVAQWYDAGLDEYIGAGGYLKIIGRCPPSGALPGGIAERPEGMLFEVELMAIAIIDEPYTQQQLNEQPASLTAEDAEDILLESGTYPLLTEG